MAILNTLASECTNLVLAIKNEECDVQTGVNTLLEFYAKGYNKGYQNCQTDHRLSKEAAQRTLDREFAEELGIIDDVMAAPYDVDYQ
jgi:hypothetical protein